jgi:hypothetical protein
VRPSAGPGIPEVVEDVPSLDRARFERLVDGLLAAADRPVSVVLTARVHRAAAVQCVVAAASHQGVAALPAEERVAARPSLDHVVAAASADHLRAVLRADPIRLLRSDDVAALRPGGGGCRADPRDDAEHAGHGERGREQHMHETSWDR